MAIGHINSKVVEGLVCPPGKDREFLWDDDLEGFGVAVFPNGSRTYYVQSRKDGRSRRVKIISESRLNAEAARKKAKILLGRMEDGVDIALVRREARAVRTFNEIGREFLKLHVTPKRKSRTGASYQTLLERHILPALGSMRVLEIRRKDVARLHAKMAKTPGAANRAVALVSAVWNWAARRDEVAFNENPAKGLERYREHGRERFLSMDELGHLGDALHLAETTGLPWQVDPTKAGAKHAPKPESRLRTLDPFGIAAIRLLLLTGCRLREILHAKWEYFDEQRGSLCLPDSKTGKKTVVLNAPALEVLSRIPRLKGNPFMFPGEKDGAARFDLKLPWAAVTKAAGLEGVRLHDLRHSFASVGAGSGMGLPIVGKLLGHADVSMTARYSHFADDPVRKASESIGATIDGALNRRTTTVIPIRR